MRVGVLLPKIAGCQLGYELIRGVPAAHAEGHDVVAFFLSVSRPHVTPPFCCMNVTESFGYDGIGVATNVATAQALLKCPGPRRKVFWVWDPEWVRGGGTYESYSGIYNNPGLELVARSRDHKTALESCWNARVAAVVGDGVGGLIDFLKGRNGEA